MKHEDIKVGMQVRVDMPADTTHGLTGVVTGQHERDRKFWWVKLEGYESAQPSGIMFLPDELVSSEPAKPTQAQRRLTLEEVKAIQRDGGRVRVLRPEGNPETNGSLWREAMIGAMHGLSYELADARLGARGFVAVRDQLGKLTDVPADCLVDANGGLRGLEPGTLVTVRKPAEVYKDELAWLPAFDSVDGKQVKIISITEDATTLKSPGKRKLVELLVEEKFNGGSHICPFFFELRWLERAAVTVDMQAGYNKPVEFKKFMIPASAAGNVWLDELSKMRNRPGMVVDFNATTEVRIDTPVRCTCTHSFFNSFKGCTCGAAAAEKARKTK